ncbi:MAG: N-acetyl-1-D-myo-inositol-2-amino-2-deoxy-alpha-D-glucopyranoside deacetylase [Ornithinimicrobium sp.]
MTAGLGDAPITVVAVHAHPDDETLATGLALAHHSLLGSEVHVITATLGEEGEVITPALAHLEGSEGLGPHRHGELSAAMRTLDVQQEYLGAPGAALGEPRWRDSGMAGSPAARHPRAFAGADVAEAAQVLALRLREISPDVLITYDPEGGYRHPDHIQTHRVSVAALRLLDPRERPRMYVAATPLSWAVEDRAWLQDHVPAESGLLIPSQDEPHPPSVAADDTVTVRLVNPQAQVLRVAALRHHPTQVTLFCQGGAEGYFALSNNIAARLIGREGYREWDVDD